MRTFRQRTALTVSLTMRGLAWRLLGLVASAFALPATAAQPWPDSSFTYIADSQLLPEGEQELSARLASVEPAVKVKVLVEEELVQSARRLLSAERSAEQVKVKSAAGGLVLLTGAASSSAEVEKLRQVLLAGVAGANEVKSEILMPEQLRKQLKDRIAAAGLADRLSVTSQEPELTLVGRLTMEEIRRWEELLVTFNRDYGNVLPIRATVSRFVPKPPVGVQAIVGGAVPYIVTPTGEHVNQGGDVNGHTLVSVKDGEVVFEGRQRVRIAR